ncbi:hypothetical protein PVMG_01634 [Plasmodium vivax Mauritania I]|uniref:Uncharacterized protein n=1 Tax=Plasmodium vivax Mauritania I TaxID=1035515 RepID=A0A0J9T6G6_PLAVI|nr:hypothetical protein PVMG_01634 [Plasmodium vivax Mauritania I]
MISANICSFIVYIFSMFILRNYFDIMQIMSVMFWYKVILIVLFAWLPFFIIKKVKNIITPSQFFKLAVGAFKGGNNKKEARLEDDCALQAEPEEYALHFFASL